MIGILELINMPSYMKEPHEIVSVNKIVTALRLIYVFYSTSGNPAMLVSMLNIPASADALKTINQSTCEITAVVPIVAIAVWAIVFALLTRAAFHHALFMFFSPLR